MDKQKQENVISRIDGKTITAQDFRENYQKQNQPVILTGLLQNCPEWDLNYLCQNIGEEIFPVRFYSKSNSLDQGVGSGVKSKNMSVNQYAQLLRQPKADNEAIYLGKCSLKNTPLPSSAILEDAEKHIGLKQPLTSFNLWLGWGGHTTSLHYDPFDGTLMQLCGEKEIILFPPSQLYNLYPLAVLNHLRFGQKLRCNPLLISRGFLGIATAGITASCIGILSDIYHGDTRLRILGYATSAMTTATIFMPLLGGWVGSFHWRWVFYLYGLSIPVAISALIILPHQSLSKTSKLNNVLGNQLLANVRKPPVIRLFITIALASAIMYSILIYSPVYLAENRWGAFNGRYLG